ncbi:hypothetical protein P9112_000635 [Eukaryota sp. TZLM1-RC]
MTVSPNEALIRKRRRRSSPKIFTGDHVDVSNIPSFRKLMHKFGDSLVLFSSNCHKVNKRNKTQERIVVVTDQAVYNLIPRSYKCKRRIPLSDLTGVSLSTLPDNFISLHCVDYDYLFMLSRKTEFVHVILSNAVTLPSSFKVNLNDTFIYRADKTNLLREVVFEPVETENGNGVSTLIFTVAGVPNAEEGGDSE